MWGTRRKTITKVCVIGGLFVLAGCLRMADRVLPPLPSAICFLMTNLLYMGLAMAWGFSISHRVLQRSVRLNLLLGCGLAMLWLFMRAVKYRFFGSGTAGRYLWYSYYIPLILAPLLSFYAALGVGRQDEERLPHAWYALLIPAGLLIAGVLSNDVHQLAFRFAQSPEKGSYTHGALYTLVMIWGIGWMTAAVAMIFNKCRVSENRKKAWIPVCVFAGGWMLCGASFMDINPLHEVPECFCLMFATLWESCIQTGLLPTNADYRGLFLESTLAAQIADGQERTLYRAKGAPTLTPEQMKAAEQGAVLLTEDLRLQSAPVHDGRVYWVENIAKINRIRERLAETNERLSEENELICAENELKLQKARIEEKNRVYDSIFSQIQTQLLRMNQLLDEKGELGLLCVLGAYVKRRANLTLICEDTAAPSVDELVYCIRESLTYLTAYGTVCTLHQEGNGFISASDAQTAYDFFETCVEAALPTLSALIVRVRCDKELSVRLMMEDAADMPNPDSFAQAGEMTVDSSDGALCVTLDFRKGGENS